MTPAQWHQLCRHSWLNHHEVQWAAERNRAQLKTALACATRSHRKRSHIARRLVMAKLTQLQQELAISCQ